MSSRRQSSTFNVLSPNLEPQTVEPLTRPSLPVVYHGKEDEAKLGIKSNGGRIELLAKLLDYFSA